MLSSCAPRVQLESRPGADSRARGIDRVDRRGGEIVSRAEDRYTLVRPGAIAITVTGVVLAVATLWLKVMAPARIASQLDVGFDAVRAPEFRGPQVISRKLIISTYPPSRASR